MSSSLARAVANYISLDLRGHHRIPMAIAFKLAMLLMEMWGSCDSIRSPATNVIVRTVHMFQSDDGHALRTSYPGIQDDIRNAIVLLRMDHENATEALDPAQAAMPAEGNPLLQISHSALHKEWNQGCVIS